MKDVVMLGGYQEAEVDFVADNPGLTLFHCHQQLHMDFGFMTLFDYALDQLVTLKSLSQRGDSDSIRTHLGERASKAVLLIRVLVGWVFLSEGIQKFLFPDSLGVGRFVKIGIPWPQVMAPFVGVVEIVCGSLLLIGLITRLATVPLLIDIAIAIYSTKIVTLREKRVLGNAA